MEACRVHMSSENKNEGTYFNSTVLSWYIAVSRKRSCAA
jgi:hypothetical protein